MSEEDKTAKESWKNVVEMDTRKLIYDGLLRVGKQDQFDQVYTRLEDASKKIGVNMDVLATEFQSSARIIERDIKYELYARFVHSVANYTKKPVINEFEWLAYIFD